MANFENISRETKRESFKGDEDRLQADTVKSPAIEIALKQKNLFAKGDDDEVEADVSTMAHIGKVGCVITMVIWSEFHIRKYRDGDPREDAPHFTFFGRHPQNRTVSGEELSFSFENRFILWKTLYQHVADPPIPDKNCFLELRWRMCLTKSFGTIKSL